MGLPSASGSDVSMSMKSPFSITSRRDSMSCISRATSQSLSQRLRKMRSLERGGRPKRVSKSPKSSPVCSWQSDVEYDVAGEHGEHVDAFFGTFELTLAAHLVGDVDDGDVEPGDAAIVDDVMATVIDPELREIGAVETVGDGHPCHLP